MCFLIPYFIDPQNLPLNSAVFNVVNLSVWQAPIFDHQTTQDVDPSKEHSATKTGHCGHVEFHLNWQTIVIIVDCKFWRKCIQKLNIVTCIFHIIITAYFQWFDQGRSQYGFWAWSQHFSIIILYSVFLMTGKEKVHCVTVGWVAYKHVICRGFNTVD